jgi:hypothetical protein
VIGNVAAGIVGEVKKLKGHLGSLIIELVNGKGVDNQ